MSTSRTLEPRVPSASDVAALCRGPLAEWYALNRRMLPWRALPPDPYAVWVSETMLQQTRVVTARPFFERWMASFPTVEALARAPLDEVLRLWAGLGYYARARSLHAAARSLVEQRGGVLPRTAAELEALPGVGRYTAGAIASVAFDAPAPVVDANVARVLSRVFAVDAEPRSARGSARLWELAAELVPRRGAGDHNQALMELGALVCAPHDPRCGACPLEPACAAAHTREPTAWPRPSARRRVVRVQHSSAVVRRGDRVLVARRHETGLWGGLWEFPRRLCAPGEDPRACAARAAREVVGLRATVTGTVAMVRHSVTHHAIVLHALACEAPRGRAQARDCAEVRWVEIEALDGLALSSPQAGVAAALRGRAAGGAASR
ncbi:MAG: A/G-specific adenine glycosylase [Chthonomonadales bacterium]|nr:A/G-specific adenine glycosylase [Chthonomonadales bacterium]